MKMISFLILLACLQTQAKETARTPNQAADFVAQVQLCEGTEALGNEGEGMGAAGFINVYVNPNSGTKQCDLAFAYGYEYGNNRGLKLGKHQSFNMTPVATGKTDCVVKEENGEITLTVSKAVNPNSKSKRTPKVLINNCKLTAQGF